MDCVEIERALLAGEHVSPALPHLQECGSCRFLVTEGGEMVHALARGGKDEAVAGLDLAALEKDVAGRLAGERGPFAWLRSLPRAGRFGLVLLLAVCEVAYFYATHRRRDWSIYPTWRMALALGSLGGILGVALWNAFRPIYLPAPRAWIGRALLAAGLIVPALFGLAPELPTISKHYSGLQSDLICLANGSVLGLAVFLAGWAVARDGRTLLLAAVAAGLSGLLVLQVECPYNYRNHLLLGHAAIPAVLLAVGAGARRLARA